VLAVADVPAHDCADAYLLPSTDGTACRFVAYGAESFKVHTPSPP
jgi:hypothetical protein